MDKDEVTKHFLDGTVLYTMKNHSLIAGKINYVEHNSVQLHSTSQRGDYLVLHSNLFHSRKEVLEDYYEIKIIDNDDDIILTKEQSAMLMGMLCMILEEPIIGLEDLGKAYSKLLEESLIEERIQKVEVGQHYDLLGETYVISDIMGLQAINTNTGEFYQCEDETFYEHAIFLE